MDRSAEPHIPTMPRWAKYLGYVLLTAGMMTLILGPVVAIVTWQNNLVGVLLAFVVPIPLVLGFGDWFTGAWSRHFNPRCPR